MGNTVSGSKDRQADESVDFGALVPQGLYTGPQDWNQQVVGHLIVERKLAPFYRPLVEYEEDWGEDQILAARKESPDAPPPSPAESSTFPSSTSSKFHRNPHKTGKEPFRPTEASIYKGAVECPICFLYYPSNINRSRCCDQAICTECFVQIKRAEPTATHLVSEPVACPYCVQENFGVTYEPPSWRTGLMSDAPPPPRLPSANSASSAETSVSRRRKSFGADSPEVVTIDQIRPDWEAKLAAVRAAAARRANRRIIMRQVGDRLIPIGITSGRTPSGEDGVAGAVDGTENGSARRSTRRRNNNGQDLNQILGSVGLGGLGGQDLEELMVMEAMRLSLLEHEEQQRRQANSNNVSSDHTQAVNGDGNGNSNTPASSTDVSPRPSISPSTRPAVPRRRSPSPGLFSGTSLRLSNTLLQPPSARAHRRVGSSPGPPSSTLSAALNAAQTATIFLNPGAERTEGHDRHIQGAPRSAPESRAASPRPVEAEMYRDGAWRGEPHASPQILTIPGRVDASSSTNEGSPGCVAETPQSDVGEDSALRNREEYKPLASSVEAGDPLLDWNR